MHLGFIMDGNRRWAEKQGLLKKLGHTAGAEIIDRVIELCIDEEVEVVTFWGLATKNIKNRSKDELDHIYSLLEKKIKHLLPKMLKNGIRFEMVGNPEIMPSHIVDLIEKTKEATKNGEKITFVLAIAYGGQEEIIRGIKNFIKNGGDIETLDEESFIPYLDTGRFSPPDLIVRTGGDMRHSGYFLYQSEYSEYYFTETLWPEFSEEEFYKAIKSLKEAKRNFGK